MIINDPFVITTTLQYSGSGNIVNQLQGKSFSIGDVPSDGSDYRGEITTASYDDANNDGSISASQNNQRAGELVNLQAGSTIPSSSGRLAWVVGVRGYNITLSDGTVLTDADFSNAQLPVRILSNNKVFLDLGNPMLSALNANSEITGISFNSNATQQADYTGFTVNAFNGTYSPICFKNGTLIRTPSGPVRVEDLRCGDLVETLDNGQQSIKWIGKRKISVLEQQQNDRLIPVKIPRGSLGFNYPSADCFVSRQHRILIKSSDRSLSVEYLVPAIKLTCIHEISMCDKIEEFEYYHILFENHEIIWANGMLAESLFTGKQALQSIPQEGLSEIREIFPDIFHPDFDPIPARPILQKQKEVNELFSLV